MTGADRGRRTGTWILAIAITAGMVGLVLAMLPGGEAPSQRSGLSAKPRGRLFAYLLLDELGLHPEVWSEAPGELPRGRSLLWLPAEPPEPPKYLRELWKRADDPDPGAGPPPSTGRERDPRHYLRFVEEGGVLLASIADGRRAFLQKELGIEALGELSLELDETSTDVSDPNVRPSPLRQTVAAQGGEPFTIAQSLRVGPYFSGGAFEPRDPIVWIRDPHRVATPLIADPDRPKRAVAWRVPVGRGAVVVLADDELFSNSAIVDRDNGLYLARLLDAIGPVDRVLFDEYALGAAVHPTALELAFAPGNAAVTLHILLALALATWWLAWTRAFPRDPAELAGASPVARAQAFGATLARLRRYAELGEMLRRGVIARLPGAGRARAALSGRDEARAAVAGIAHSARDADEVERWRRALEPGSIESAQELEGFARDLAPIERLASVRLASGARDRHNPDPRGAMR